MSKTKATAAEKLKTQSFKFYKTWKSNPEEDLPKHRYLPTQMHHHFEKGCISNNIKIPTKAGVATADHEKCTG